MKTYLAFCAPALFGALVAAQTMRHYSPGTDSLTVHPPEQVIEKTFSAGPGAALKVDNVNGGIHVTGDGGDSIRITARETIAADSDAAVARARRDVHLDMTQANGVVTLYVDGPFRCQSDSNDDCGSWRSEDGQRHWSKPGYEVTFDFEVHVPKDAGLDLATVNHGSINVEDVHGDFKTNNINGGIDLEEMSGSGRAYTINGPVKVSYRSNPKADCTFGSLNGAVNVFFQPGLAADLSYKTFNGAVYSDFAVVALPRTAVSSAARGNMRVYRSNQFTGGRVGNGGPQIKLDGFNGNVYIHQR